MSKQMQEPLLSNAGQEEDIAVPVVPTAPPATATATAVAAPPVATPMPSGDMPAAQPLVEAQSLIDDSHIPRNRWRDDLCNCCSPGCFHPSCCIACCCTPILLGQVMQRFNLGLTGAQVTPAKAKQAFMIILIVTVVNAVIFGGPAAACADMLSNGNGTCNPFSLISYIVISLWNLYILVLIIFTRMYIKKKYQIKKECCGSSEVDDCCAAFFCGCCAVSQMARHTADYNRDCGQYCTNTGLPDDSPSLV